MTSSVAGLMVLNVLPETEGWNSLLMKIYKNGIELVNTASIETTVAISNENLKKLSRDETDLNPLISKANIKYESHQGSGPVFNINWQHYSSIDNMGLYYGLAIDFGPQNRRAHYRLFDMATHEPTGTRCT